MKKSLTQGISFSRFILSAVLSILFIVEPAAFAQSKVKPALRLNIDQRVLHVISRVTFGARPGDVEQIKKTGLAIWIDRQLSPEFIDDTALDKRLAALPTLSLPTPVIADLYNPPPKPAPTPAPAASPSTASSMDSAPQTDMQAQAAIPDIKPSPTPAPKPTPPPRNPQQVVTELQRAKLLRAVYSERQLFEVLVDFWENHFSIYSGKDSDRLMLTSFDRDSVRPFALGRFRDLLGATAHSPAMLYYLDNWQSSLKRSYPATKDRPARETGGINENYARELMELHTLGVNGGYTQKDVEEVARCFTGWTVRKPNQEGTFIFNPSMHDPGEKIVLGQKIPAGGGIADAEKVLDILARHPSTARFIVTKLARRFLGDDPPPAAIDRAARIYLKTDGSIRETFRSLLTSPEFFSRALYRSKVRSPFEFVTAALRITAAKTDGSRPVLDWISRMGQPVFGHRTPEGFSENSRTWLSNNELLTRLNFLGALVTGQIKGTTIDAKVFSADIGAGDPAAAADRLSQTVLMNETGPATKKELDRLAADAISKIKLESTTASVARSENSPEARGTADSMAKPPLSKPPDYLMEMIILALGSPEFQRK